MGNIIVPKITLPETGFVRLPNIIGDPKADPPIAPIIPVSKSTWWAGVKSGRYPQPIKLGPRITAWRVEDIRELVREARTFQGGMDNGQNWMAGGADGLGKDHV
ncbi:helix-turn-helix transcriptional regulator [Geobacter sulfurreducens]|uniref:helix-turn-helix transcriptional regulator n=1 Tax=Geobacter sulfurreducens TaxID=35554 RepID=UPI0001D8F576|nr:AlpA family phage regulatory protein [Geobacter sulfurreducens]ADI83305.1 phage regulatory protein, AlpA family [Geobacter sulfurreducens KN400]